MKQRERPPAEYDTCAEFGAVFQISDSTVRRAIAKGQVRAIKVGGSIRIPKSERERVRRGEGTS